MASAREHSVSFPTKFPLSVGGRGTEKMSGEEFGRRKCGEGLGFRCSSCLYFPTWSLDLLEHLHVVLCSGKMLRGCVNRAAVAKHHTVGA